MQINTNKYVYQVQIKMHNNWKYDKKNVSDLIDRQWSHFTPGAMMMIHYLQWSHPGDFRNTQNSKNNKQILALLRKVLLKWKAKEEEKLFPSGQRVYVERQRACSSNIEAAISGRYLIRTTPIIQHQPLYLRTKTCQPK